ncbi:MAG: DUF6515 family protein [Verrucomicrobiota bacterium]
MKTPLHLTCAGVLAVCASSCVTPDTTMTATTTTYQPGYTVTSLPSGYSTVTVEGQRYYQSNDVYYRSEGGRYVVVGNPYGGRTYGTQSFSDRGSRSSRGQGSRGTPVMRRLPTGAQVRTHAGVQYYEHGGTFYRAEGDGYMVVPSPY